MSLSPFNYGPIFKLNMWNVAYYTDKYDILQYIIDRTSERKLDINFVEDLRLPFGTILIFPPNSRYFISIDDFNKMLGITRKYFEIFPNEVRISVFDKNLMTGSQLYIKIGELYLKNLHSSIVEVLPEIFYGGTDIYDIDKFKLQTLLYTTRKKFIIMGLGIFPKCISTTSIYGHQNMLIIDVDTKEIERFEPYGHMVPPLCPYIDDNLKYYFQTNFGLTYIPPYSYSYPLQFQFIDDITESSKSFADDPGGFCSVWSIIWADYRLRNPAMSRSDAIRTFDNYIRTSSAGGYKNFIRQYDDFIRLFAKQIMSSKNEYVYGLFNVPELVITDYKSIPKINSVPFISLNYAFSYWFNLASMIWLASQNKNACVVIPLSFDPRKVKVPTKLIYGAALSSSSVDLDILKFNNTLVTIYESSAQKLHFPPLFDETFNACLSNKDIDFIMFPVYIWCEFHHMSFVLYDMRRNIVERFETYGREHPSKKIQDKINICITNLDNQLKNYFNLRIPGGVIFEPPSMCPSIQHMQESEKLIDTYIENLNKTNTDGIQYVKPNGFCAAWSIFFADIIMKNPLKNRKDLELDVLKYINKNYSSLTEFIIYFTTHVSVIGDQLMKSENIFKDYYEMLKMNINKPRKESVITSVVYSFNKKQKRKKSPVKVSKEKLSKGRTTKTKGRKKSPDIKK